MRLQREHREILALARKYLPKSYIETAHRRKHPRLILVGETGLSRIIIIPSSGSDRRGLLNLERDIRHQLPFLNGVTTE